jgi:triphosphoribosyl-dephospho-CoA synthase
VRAEALGGFSGAFTIGLPTLQQAVKRGQNMNQAMVTALLQLMTCTEDSNAVYRGGLGGLTFLQQGAETLLQAADPEGTVDFHAVRDFDRQCTERNLSPGGSADLLALSAMLYLILEDEGGREACWKEQLPEQ